MSIFAELKRRNIFRVALLYIVSVWLILQVAEILFELLGVPGWVFRFIFALLIIGFPLTLVFSWIFEITPQGLKKGRHVDAHASITAQTGRKINVLTVVLLACAILAAIVNQLLA